MLKTDIWSISVSGALLLTGFGAAFLLASYAIFALRPIDSIVTSVSYVVIV